MTSIQDIEAALNSPPLHRDAQPEHNADLLDLRVDTFIPAAVLIAITQREKPGVLLTHRPSTMRAHAGQVAFPGGKVDPGDADNVSAALREADEELGIAPQKVRIIGQDILYRSVSGFDVTPVIGVVPPDIRIIPHPTEVASWFEAPLAYILNPDNIVRKYGVWKGQRRGYYEIMWQEHRIWGVTADIIVNLARRLGMDIGTGNEHNV